MVFSATRIAPWYSVGMSAFMVHFSLVNPQALRRKNVWPSLVFWTMFWWLAYLVSWAGNRAEAPTKP